MTERPPIPDRSHWSDPFGRRHGGDIEVICDGKPVQRVVWFDRQIGKVNHLASDEDGRVKLDYGRGVVVDETLSGRVEVRWRS